MVFGKVRGKRRVSAREQQIAMVSATLGFTVYEFPEAMIEQFSQFVETAQPHQISHIQALRNKGYKDSFIADAMTYISVTYGIEHVSDALVTTLNCYRQHSWYPDASGQSAVPKIAAHLQSSLRLVREIESFGASPSESLTFIGRARGSRSIWGIADERLVQHLYEHPEDVETCSDIVEEHGALNYGLLRAKLDGSPNAFSDGTL